jgi:ABC-2 type transport system ATP-binding protein
MSELALRFHQVSQRYAQRSVLDGVDLAVRPGEFFGLAGVNGAGKTSMIKCMFDFCALEAGSIDIFGVGHRLPAARQPLAFLPERFTPPYYLTGADFLRYFLTLQGVRYQPALARELAGALDLEEEALRRTVRSYSKGMTQKLGLLGCLLADKDMLVLDEPMSGLDPKARALLKRQLQQLRQRGRTLLFTSHALADIEELCDRMAILHQGRIRFTGTPEACRAAYGVATLEQAFMECIR